MAAQALLDRIVSDARPPVDGRVLVVVAHPDDETLGCGALLARCPALTVVHVTDGAPPDGADARDHGFASTSDYAAARRREVAAALAAGGAGHARLLCLGLPDQGAAFAMAEMARRLVPLVAAAELVLAHAPEGGHPDHDATALAVQAARALLAADGPAPPLVEFPLYRAGDASGWTRQEFPPEAGGVRILRLSAEERARKAAMLAAHATQRRTLAAFGAADEPYRPADPLDPAGPPGRGRALYEGQGWGMTAARFRDLVRDAVAELGLRGAACA